MAYSPIPTPPPPGASSSVASLPDPVPETGSIALSEEVLHSLRERIAKRDYDLPSMAGWIAQAAHAVTGASAAAIAMRHEGVVVCMGRSGELAPELGARLSVDSGISGECLRTGKILRCDDTQKDFRADPEVCRRLGLQSIAAVPLRGRYGIMGVLEAFSNRSYAFSEEHVNALRELAELAETGRANLIVPAPEVESVATESAASDVETAPAEISTAVGLRSFHLNQPRYWIATSAIAALLLAGVVWRLWRPASAPVSTNAVQAATPETGSSTVAQPAQTVIEWKPSPVRATNRDNRENVTSADDVVTRALNRQPESTGAQNATAPEKSSAADSSAKLPESTTVEPPRIVASASDTSTLGRVLSGGDSTMPELATTVSSGISGGKLMHKVNPVYPEQALSFRLQGPVVMQATITETGTVENLSVISGQPILAGAASSAVRQWRYSPFVLNGKPIRMRTQITVTFKAP